MKTNDDQLARLGAEALHHHEQCQRHRQGMFREALLAGTKFAEIRRVFLSSGDAQWRAKWGRWQRRFRREHGVSERKVREYISIANEWNQPWCHELRQRECWEPQSIAQFHRVARDAKQAPDEALRRQIRDAFEIDVLQSLGAKELTFLAEAEDYFLTDYLTKIREARSLWVKFTDNYDTESDYNNAMAKIETRHSARRRNVRRH